MSDAVLVLLSSCITVIVTEGSRWLIARGDQKNNGRKSDAEAEDISTRTLMATLDVAWERANELENKVQHLNVVVDALLSQLRTNGITPVYPPMPPIVGGE